MSDSPDHTGTLPGRRGAGRLFGTRALAIAGLVAAVAGLVAGMFGEAWLPLDVLAHFRVHFIGGAIVFAVAALLPRLRALFAIGGLILVVIGIGLWEPAKRWAGIGQTPAAGTANTLRIVSFNTWLANTDWQVIERYLRGADADVVVLVEFGDEKQEMLDRLRDLYPHQEDCIDRHYCHMALLSRRPWAQSGVQSGREGAPPYVWAKFGPELGGLNLIGTHIVRAPHLRAQMTQLDRLGDAVNELEGPVVIAGDFNATPWSHAFRRFTARTGLDRSARYLPSWPVYSINLPQLPIDHVFVSSEIRPLHVTTGPALGSDHLPIETTLQLPEAN